MEAADITYKIVPSVADQGTGEGWDVGNGLANSSLLIHSDTTNGSTTFVDTVGTHSPVFGAADVEHDTDQARFGKSSILFDGDSGYITIPDHADFNYGSGLVTNDFWIRFVALPTDGNDMYFLSQDGGAAIFQRFYLNNTGGTYTINYHAEDPPWAIDDISKEWSGVVIDKWYHLALIRGWGGGANVWAVCVDGKSIGTTTNIDDAADVGAALEIGISIGNDSFMNGWMDEIRVSKGVARWTKNFIPPYGSYR